MSQGIFKNIPCGAGSKKWWKREAQVRWFGILFWSESVKFRSPRTSTKTLRNNIDIDAKWMPTWSQTRCPNSSKINSKTGSEQKSSKTWKSMFVWCVKTYKFTLFGGLAGCVRERKSCQKNIKKYIKFRPCINDKSIPISWSKMWSRKRRASSKLDSRRDPKTIINQ